MSPGLFLLRVIGAMVPAFFIWWIIGSVWLQPAVILTDYLLSAWFPYTFYDLKLVGNIVVALTQWDNVNGTFVPSSMIGTHLGINFNIRVLSYSFPFFFALQIALWDIQNTVKIAMALIALYLVLIISMAVVLAKMIMINLGLEPVFIETTLYWYANPELIILGHQAATLLLPTLAPTLLWIAVNQNRIKGFISK